MLFRTPLDIGQAIRDRRRRLSWDQEELAQRVGASRKWLIEVEKGKPRAEIGLLLRTLHALGLRLSVEVDSPTTSQKGRSAAIPTVNLDRVLDNARNKSK